MTDLDDRWYHHAACLGVDPAIFVGINGLSEKRRFGKAAAICAECPVRRECFEDAMGIEELPVWQGSRAFAMFQAGLSPDQLTKLYQEREDRKAA